MVDGVAGPRWRVGRLAAVLVAFGLACTPLHVLAEDDVALARLRYNEGRYDAAIELADSIWNTSRSDAAAVVLARARLERFRERGLQPDLEAGRDLLRAVDPLRLSRTERADWELGVATGLYLIGDFGPAAEILDRLLREGTVGEADRDRLVDWWAGAIDQAGRHLDRPERTRTYDRLADRLEAELGRNPTSPAATYWLVAAVRGSGDLWRAWNLGVASWVRAGAGNVALRSDLDRLMLQGVIPDLAVARTQRPFGHRDTIGAMAELAGDWEAIKAGWDAP